MTARIRTQVAVIDKVAEGAGWPHRLVAYSDCWIKRALDVLVSLLGLLVLAPFFLLIAVLIKRDSSGPVFYRGRRLGYQGRTFDILKFRTMYERPQSYQGPPVTAYDDPRVTRVGRWLRARKLNELPQLWNVLKGEMSLVGPRPEDPHIGENWSPEARREVLSVRPGITSPASVLYRDEENWLASKEVMQAYLESFLPSKLRLDQIYVRHRSIWLDLDILLWTCLVLLPRLQEYQPAEAALFTGLFSRIVSGQLITEVAQRWLRLRGRARAAQERVLIIGGGETGQFAAWLLGGNRAGDFYLAGFVDDDLYKHGPRIAGLQVLGGRADIPRLVEELDIGILVFAVHTISQEERQRLVEICDSTPARVVHMPDILGVIEQAPRPD